MDAVAFWSFWRVEWKGFCDLQWSSSRDFEEMNTIFFNLIKQFQKLKKYFNITTKFE